MTHIKKSWPHNTDSNLPCDSNINACSALSVQKPNFFLFQNIAGSYATTPLITSLAGIFLVYAICKISTFIYDEVTSPLRHVPGPPSPGFIYGNFKQLADSVESEQIY